MAGTGVPAETCNSDNTTGVWPSLALTNNSLEALKTFPLAEPNEDDDASRDMITRPAVPSVSFANGCREVDTKVENIYKCICCFVFFFIVIIAWETFSFNYIMLLGLVLTVERRLSNVLYFFL